MTVLIVVEAALEEVVEDTYFGGAFRSRRCRRAGQYYDATGSGDASGQTAGFNINSTEVVAFDTIRLTGDRKFQDAEMPVCAIGGG